MLRRVAFVFTGLLLATLFACGGGSRDEAQNQNQPAAAQQPGAAQQPPAQAQPAEQAPVREAAPAPAKAPRRPAAARTATQPATSRTAAPAEPGAPVATAGQPVAAPKQVSEAQPAAAPPQPVVRTLWIPANTRFEVRLLDPISSKDNKAGDKFKATLNQDLEADGQVVVPRGSTVTGKILEVKQPGRVQGRAAMSITLTQITVGETSYPIQTNTLSFEAESSVKGDATKVGIGAGLGAIIGAIAGGGKGAAIGAAVGGGAGTATVLATKGKDVKFAPEEKFSFVLNNELGIKR